MPLLRSCTLDIYLARSAAASKCAAKCAHARAKSKNKKILRVQRVTAGIRLSNRIVSILMEGSSEFRLGSNAFARVLQSYSSYTVQRYA